MVRKLYFIAILSVVALRALAADPVMYQVKQDFAPVFYIQDGKVVGSEFLERGTKFACDRIENNLCYITWQGKVGYVRLASLEKLPDTAVAAAPTPPPSPVPPPPVISPEEKYRQEQIAKGLVEYRGGWVTPQEKFRQEQTAKGLIEINGEWITKDEQFRREQLAKGLVLDGKE